MRHKVIRAAILGSLLAAVTAPAHAATADPDDDFMATYTGPPVQEVDLRSMGVSFDGAAFTLSATVDDVIGLNSNSYFVWGINRGAGAPRVAIKPDVLFDAIFIAYADRSAEYSLLPPPNFSNLPGIVQLAGNTMTAVIPLSLLPSNGFLPDQYRFTVWTHYAPLGPIGAPDHSGIADFSSTVVPAAIPEPSTWALLIAGFGAAGMAMRRTRRRLPSPGSAHSLGPKAQVA